MKIFFACIVSPLTYHQSTNHQAWELRCDVKVLNPAGNLADAVAFATLASLRAFRRPEVTISREVAGPIAVVVHPEEEREPLPLALHHTPVSVTLGIVRNASPDTSLAGGVLFLDPCNYEEAVMDGSISFSINAQKEICSILKPGGCGLSTSDIIGSFALST
jgi:exosome complex component RRP45